MQLIFVHGWSVTHTDTYGALPQSLASAATAVGIPLRVNHIHLGKYISFHDEVSLDDIAQALDQALRELSGNSNSIAPFSCITHSTGGPVVRHWIDKYYGSKNLSQLPLQHLVMLAPANHGSALAAIGKERIGRIKASFSGTEPGQRVLDWLSLGSTGQWDLNQSFLSYRSASKGFYPFSLIGQGIDRKAYDFLNSYLVEPGSDGVVRVAGANMNCRFLSLQQSTETWKQRRKASKLTYNPKRPVRTPQQVPLAVFSQFSHSGDDMGIMAIDRNEPDHALIVEHIIKCLNVSSAEDYKQVGDEFETFSTLEQQKTPIGKGEAIGRYAMLVFRVRDNASNVISCDDLDILLLAGSSYSPNKLPKGFFVDKQVNRSANSLVYYVNADVMAKMPDERYGVRVVARPEEGFSHYEPAEFHSEGIPINQVIAPNETTYIDITLNRLIDKNVFRFSPANKKRKSFKRISPSGQHLDNK